MKRTTIKDIAKYLEVNVSTVSRALADKSGVSESLKKKVRDTADLLNYIPNNSAKNFRDCKTNTIALILPKMNMFFIPSIIKSVYKTLSERNMRLLILLSEGDPEMERNNIVRCSNYGVDGILISLTERTNNIDHLLKARELGIPIVLLDKTVSQSYFDEIVIDDYKTAFQLTQSLIEKKPQKILCVMGHPNLNITQKREKGVVEALSSTEIPYKITYAASSEEAKSIMEENLDNHDFDALFLMSEEILSGVFSYLLNYNINVEQYTMAVISSGEMQLPSYDNLLVAKHDAALLGEKACMVILDRVGKDPLSIIPKTIYSKIVFS